MGVEEVDLVDRNKEGAKFGGEPLGTIPLQPIQKVLERFPDIYVRLFATILDDPVIEDISICLIRKEFIEDLRHDLV